MVRISDDGPAGNKAEPLSLVNHSAKTVHHQCSKGSNLIGPFGTVPQEP